MRVLFIVQGEGRGHLTQAITLEKLLRDNGYEVVEVLVGKSEFRRLPGFFNRSIHAPIKQFVSPNFLPTRDNRCANLSRSILYNILKLPEYVKSMYYIHTRIQASRADIVINFYELLTGLTYFFFRPSAPMLCIGHQYLFLHKEFTLPKGKKGSLLLMNFFSRLTSLRAKCRLALSFRPMRNDGKTHVVPPLLREDVFAQDTATGNYIHGYMLNTGFADYVQGWHEKHPAIPLRFFWDNWEEDPIKKVDETLSFYQLDDVEFLRQMSGCKAYASTAGFESICEAMYLGKPILMVPVHIEQECNALDAIKSGAGIVNKDFNLDCLLEFAETYRPNTEFVRWAQSSRYVMLDELEQLLPQNQIQHMYMVEDFV